MKKIINSFIVDDGTKRFHVELTRFTTGSRLIRYIYVVKYYKYFDSFFTKFFAKRVFTKLKKGYKSCWLQYKVYDDIK